MEGDLNELGIFERMVKRSHIDTWKRRPYQVAGQEGLGGEQGKKGWRGEERS